MLFIIKQYFFINAIHPAFVISDQWNGSDLSGVSITGTSVSGNLIWYQYGTYYSGPIWAIIYMW